VALRDVVSRASRVEGVMEGGGVNGALGLGLGGVISAASHGKLNFRVRILRNSTRDIGIASGQRHGRRRSERRRGVNRVMRYMEAILY
jgi:hypothetical protein